jgi:hypothetical protein
MPKLQKKPSALKIEHPVLKNMKILDFFLYFCGSFLPSWIRILIRKLNTAPDPDPATQINAYPDPKPWFLGIILIILKLEVSTFVLHFYKMLFMNKLEFSSLTDCFVWIFETIGVRYGFLSGFSPFDAFLSVVSAERRCIYI